MEASQSKTTTPQDTNTAKAAAFLEFCDPEATQHAA